MAIIVCLLPTRPTRAALLDDLAILIPVKVNNVLEQLSAVRSVQY